MIDFLKNHPAVTRDEYMWEWTVPQIELASFDYSHIITLSEKEKRRRKRKGKIKGQRTYNRPDDFAKALNLPTIKK